MSISDTHLLELLDQLITREGQGRMRALGMLDFALEKMDSAKALDHLVDRATGHTFASWLAQYGGGWEGTHFKKIVAAGASPNEPDGLGNVPCVLAWLNGPIRLTPVHLEKILETGVNLLATSWRGESVLSANLVEVAPVFAHARLAEAFAALPVPLVAEFLEKTQGRVHASMEGLAATLTQRVLDARVASPIPAARPRV